MHTIKVKYGFIDKSILPNGLIPKHDKKLIVPNSNPIIPPKRGPVAAAQTTTGIIIKVISTTPILRYPNGVKDIIMSIAASRAKSTILFVFKFIFPLNKRSAKTDLPSFFSLH